MIDILSAALTQIRCLSQQTKFVDLNILFIGYFSTRSSHHPAILHSSCQVIEHVTEEKLRLGIYWEWHPGEQERTVYAGIN